MPLFEDLFPGFPNCELVKIIDFETAELAGRLNFAPDWKAEITAKKQEVIAGKKSLKCDTRNSKEEWHLYFQTDPKIIQFKPGETYQITFDYKILSEGDETRNKGSQKIEDFLGINKTPFAIALRTDTGGWQKDLGTSRIWSGPSGTMGKRTVWAEIKDYNDYYLFFSIRGKAALAIDNIKIERVAAGFTPAK